MVCGRRSEYAAGYGGKNGGKSVKTSDFYFDLPEELIAQTPLERRDSSRLLTLDKTTGRTQHMHFYDLPSLLRPCRLHSPAIPWMIWQGRE